MSEPRTTYTTGAPPTGLEATIIQVVTFADGSRLRLFVDAPAGEDLSEAHRVYYLRLFKILESIGQPILVS